MFVFALRFGSIVTDLFTALTDAVSGAIDVITAALDGVTGIFYTPGVAEAPGVLTIYGYLLLIGAAMGMVFMLINWVRGLIRMRG